MVAVPNLQAHDVVPAPRLGRSNALRFFQLKRHRRRTIKNLNYQRPDKEDPQHGKVLKVSRMNRPMVMPDIRVFMVSK